MDIIAHCRAAVKEPGSAFLDQEARGFLPRAAAPLRATRAGRIPRDSFTAVEQVAKFL